MCDYIIVGAGLYGATIVFISGLYSLSGCSRQIKLPGIDIVIQQTRESLQGLLDANNDNVIIVRIERQDNVNKMSILENQKVKDL